LLDCTSWQHKDQPLHLYRANQHGLPLETVIMREPVVSEWGNLFLKNPNPTTVCTP